MTDRYISPTMARTWSPEGRLDDLLHAAVLAAGVTDREYGLNARLVAGVREVRSAYTRTDDKSPWIAQWRGLEARYHHDIAAFVELVRDTLPDRESARFFHLNRTSSDLVDTALAYAIRNSKVLIDAATTQLLRALARRAHEYRDELIRARTHGQFAEITTIGRRFAYTLAAVEESIVPKYDVGKLSGPVGTGTNEHTSLTLSMSGLREPTSTQVVPRHYLARHLGSLAAATVPLSDLAVLIRLGSREEGYSWCRESRGGAEARGSSAMPTKRNPVRSERVSGLCTRIRSSVASVVEADAGLWEERDISHSSVERLALPEIYGLTEFVYLELADVVDRLEVYPDPQPPPLVTPALALSVLVRLGLEYDDAYGQVRQYGPEGAVARNGVWKEHDLYPRVGYDPESEPDLWKRVDRWLS